jgi:hypothetical protein
MKLMGRRGEEIRNSNRGDKFNQSILYGCIEISQGIPFCN